MKKAKWDSMGKVVLVTAQFKRHKQNDSVWWTAQNMEPRAGWIVGYRSLQEGKIVRGYGYYGSEDYDPPYLDVERTVPCVLISFTPSYENPVKVPLSAIEETDQKPRATSTGMEVYSKEEIASWPRDEKGRWTLD
jgi:hypothetical protein